ncbi:hypothetical protein RFI_14385, partial [Reticulomyxa filosa]
GDIRRAKKFPSLAGSKNLCDIDIAVATWIGLFTVVSNNRKDSQVGRCWCAVGAACDHWRWSFDWFGFPIFVGNASFLFVLHPVILSLEQQMIVCFFFNRNLFCVMERLRLDAIERKVKKKKSLLFLFVVSNQMKKALFGAVNVVLVANTFFADFIYICWSEKSKDDFPQNIVTALDEGAIQIFTKVLLCIDLLFTYAIVMYPFTEALELRLLDRDKFGTKFCNCVCL